jgi:hypothetical protein
VFIKNTDSGVTRRIEAVSDGNGLVSIDLNDLPNFINDVSIFAVWIGDYVDILVGETTVNCISLSFSKVFDGDGVPVSSEIQTVEI